MSGRPLRCFGRRPNRSNRLPSDPLLPFKIAYERAGTARKRSSAEGAGCAKSRRSRNKLRMRDFNYDTTVLNPRLRPRHGNTDTY
jgi:hypothetical protein